MEMSESEQDRKSINQYINSRSASSTLFLPESLLVDETATPPSQLSASGMNHELSPTPLDINRINFVDELPFQSFLTNHNEECSEMFISLLKDCLPPDIHDSCTFKYITPDPLQSEGGKIEHVFDTSQEMPHGKQATTRATLKNSPLAETTYAKSTPHKRPRSDITSSEVSSPQESSFKETKPEIGIKKKRNRSLNADQWHEKRNELQEYKNTFGHCHVPHNWKPNVALAQWVKRQRYQVRSSERSAELQNVVSQANLMFCAVRGARFYYTVQVISAGQAHDSY
jgi:hypothetical protein